MKKMSIWVLVVALILGSGFVAMAAETECIPPCQGNLETFKKTVDVKLKVAPWVELFFVDGSIMEICYAQPGKPLVGNNDIRFQGRSNTPIQLNFASQGFGDGVPASIINESLRYYVSMFGGWDWPMSDVQLQGFKYLAPGGSQTVEPAIQGRWHGHVKAEGSWPYTDWENLDAGDYTDVVTITVAAANL